MQVQMFWEDAENQNRDPGGVSVGETSLSTYNTIELSLTRHSVLFVTVMVIVHFIGLSGPLEREKWEVPALRLVFSCRGRDGTQGLTHAGFGCAPPSSLIPEPRPSWRKGSCYFWVTLNLAGSSTMSGTY